MILKNYKSPLLTQWHKHCTCLTSYQGAIGVNGTNVHKMYLTLVELFENMCRNTHIKLLDYKMILNIT